MLDAVLYRLRGLIRSSWGSLLALTLLIAVAGGAVMASAGAARRTGTAFDRLVSTNRVADALINPDDESSDSSATAPAPLTIAEVRSLPSVARAGRLSYVFVAPGHVDSLQQVITEPDLMVPSGGVDESFDRLKVDEGRMPNQSKPYEVFVQRWWADQHHIRVGDRIPIRAVTGDESQALEAKSFSPDFVSAMRTAGKPVELTVVGIGGGADSVLVDRGYEPNPWLGTRAFQAKYHQLTGISWDARVGLKPGATVEQLRSELAKLHPDQTHTVQGLDAISAQVDEAVSPQVVALWTFCGIAAFVALLVVGQALSRRLSTIAVDNYTLDAMGMTHRDRFALAMIEVVAVAIGGAVLAVVIAVSLSPLAPIGAARLAEPSPGLRLDWSVIALGLAGVVVVTTVLGLWPAWRSSRIGRQVEISRPSRTANALAGAGASVAAVTGVRFAFESGNRSRPIPTRSSLIGASLAVLVVVSVITFANSLDHLLTNPALYGQTADQVLHLNAAGSPTDPGPILARVDRTLRNDPRVARWSVIVANDVKIGAGTVPVVALQPGARPIAPVISSGRAPRGTHEIALGSSTMSELHTHLGDTILLGSDRSPVKVVGFAILPAVARYPGAQKAGLGEGALLSPAAVDRFGGPTTMAPYYSIQTTGGLTGQELAAKVKKVVPTGIQVTVSSPPEPSNIAALKALRATPVVLAGLLVLLITATVIHAVVLAIRRRRGDLAVLQAMGMRPGQVIRSALWQATTIALIAGVVGVPLGIIVGRWAWILLAHSLGVFEHPIVPIAAITLAGAVVLLAANLVGLVPGWRVAHRHPGIVLRAE
jgi:ABC-type lipoprotein release transport system permease subunit